MWDPRAARCVVARETRGAPPACRAPRFFPAGSGDARGLATPEAEAKLSSPWAPRSSKGRSGPVAGGCARGAAPAFPAPGDEGTRCDRTAAARGLPGTHPCTEAAAPGPTSHLPRGTPGPLAGGDERASGRAPGARTLAGRSGLGAGFAGTWTALAAAGQEEVRDFSPGQASSLARAVASWACQKGAVQSSILC